MSSSPSVSARPHQARRGPILDDTQLVPKRPRIGVVVACDRCRLKKIRCDGNRPTCMACSRKGLTQCHYEEPSAKNPNARYLFEGIRLLLSMTPSQATSALLAVGDLDKDAEIIAVLRDLASNSAKQTTYFTGPSTGFARFLERKHPVPYPILDPSDPREPRRTVRLLIRSRFGPQQYHEKIPVDKLNLAENIEQAAADARQVLSPKSYRLSRGPDLDDLDISRWTTVPVSKELAIRLLSTYLEADHLLMSPVQGKLFLQTLLSPEPDSFCCPSLVNALLYWCCQRTASADQEAEGKAELFRLEAERHLKTDARFNTASAMATSVLLGLGHLMQGKENAMLGLLSNATNAGVTFRLFGVPEDVGWAALSRMSPEEIQATMHPTWSAFNWILLTGTLFEQDVVFYPEYPPVMPIPDPGLARLGNGTDDGEDEDLDGTVSSEELLFPSLCRFWRIMQGVNSVYHGHRTTLTQDATSLQFAEFKYRELLAWVDELPPALSRSDENPDIVLVLHLWLHSAVLDIFRPFLRDEITFGSKQRLRTFAAPGASPDDAYNASLHQLKHLILGCSSPGTSTPKDDIIWQTAVLYAAATMLRSADEDRLEYFLMCLYSLRHVRAGFGAILSMAKATLSTAVQRGEITATMANMIISDWKAEAPPLGEHGIDGRAAPPWAVHPVDLDSVMLNPESVSVEQMALQLDDKSLVNKYTSLFGDEAHLEEQGAESERAGRARR